MCAAWCAPAGWMWIWCGVSFDAGSGNAESQMRQVMADVGSPGVSLGSGVACPTQPGGR